MTATVEATLLCRRGPRCANHTTHPHTNPNGTTTKIRIPDRATTTGGLCRTDTHRVRAAVEQIPRDYAELGDLLGKTGGATDAPTSGTRDLPVPLRLGILTLQEEIAEEIDLWAEAVAERVHVPWHAQNERTARAVHAGRAVNRGSALLTDHLDTLLALPQVVHLVWVPGEAHVQLAKCTGGHWHAEGGRCTDLHLREVWRDDNREWASCDGVDGALRLLDLHERVALVEGRTHRTHQLWSPCPRCQTLALRREEGSPHVICALCGHLMNMDQYDALANVLARAYGATAA